MNSDKDLREAVAETLSRYASYTHVPRGLETSSDWSKDKAVEFIMQIISEDRQKMIEYVLGEPTQILVQVNDQEFLNGGYAKVSDQWQCAQEYQSKETTKESV